MTFHNPVSRTAQPVFCTSVMVERKKYPSYSFLVNKSKLTCSDISIDPLRIESPREFSKIFIEDGISAAMPQPSTFYDFNLLLLILYE
ncbi:hypothetical protein Hanom_Chr00s000981g01670931 [Helianthus anomalus]